VPPTGHRIDSPPELFADPSDSLAPTEFNFPSKGARTVRAHRTLVVSAILAVAFAIPAGAAARRLIIGGSTSVLPLAQKLASAYHQAFPKIPAPKVGGGQSDIGISGAASGRFDIGDSSRDPIKGVDPTGLVFTKVARDGVCVITNPSNPISNLSQENVEAIFTGRIRDWSQIPGATISGPIDLFDRDGASGTQDAFQHIFLGETLKISPSATAKTSNGLEQNAVSSDKQAIGFVSFAYTSGVNAVGYNGIPCTLRNAKSGQYAGVRNFWMVTKGAPKGEAAKFLAWVTSGNATTKSIINSSWIAVH
jgi:phosphate transport system substrate-binding protein